MNTPKLLVPLLVLMSLLGACMAASRYRAGAVQQCSSPTVYLFDDSASCTGEPDIGPFFDPNVCSGNCSAIPNGHYSMDYKCDAHAGLRVLTSFAPACAGPFSKMDIQTSRCSRLMGTSTSFALTCDQNDPILPPLSTQPASWGNGTFIPSFGPCLAAGDCPPGMPFRTAFSGPNCQGAGVSSTFSNNAVVDGCYLVPWPFDLNLRMTCDRRAGLLSFNIGASCDESPFLSLTYPTETCINDADGYGSSLYSCGAPANMRNPKVREMAEIYKTQTVDQQDVDTENKRPKALTEDMKQLKKKMTTSFEDIIRQHPLSASNPLLKRFLNKMH